MPFASGAYTKFKDFVNGGTVTPSDLDSIQTDLGDQIASIAVAGGYNSTGEVRRGKFIQAATGTRTNVAYGALSNGPDQVASVILPTDGLLVIRYHAVWQESVENAARASIFIGANEVKHIDAAAVAFYDRSAGHGADGGNHDGILGTYSGGLASGIAYTGSPATYPGDITTGQVFSTYLSNTASSTSDSSPLEVFAAAGTYTISVQFKASSGTVSVKNRKLFVEVKTFS